MKTVNKMAHNAASYSVKKKVVPGDYFASLHRSFGTNEKVKQEMINIFCQQIPSTLAKLEESIAQADYTTFHFDIHRIKSTINIIGLPHLLELSTIMEKYTYEKTALDTLPALFIQFKKQLQIDLEIIENKWGNKAISINQDS